MTDILLPLPLRERGGVRGLGSGMFSHCHSGSFLLVIPDVSHPVIPDFSRTVIPDVSRAVIPDLFPLVIPDVINRESKG